jgi:hypothetical protein
MHPDSSVHDRQTNRETWLMSFGFPVREEMIVGKTAPAVTLTWSIYLVDDLTTTAA